MFLHMGTACHLFDMARQDRIACEFSFNLSWAYTTGQQARRVLRIAALPT